MSEVSAVVLPIAPLISIGFELPVVRVNPKAPLIDPISDKVPVFLIDALEPSVMAPA